MEPDSDKLNTSETATAHHEGQSNQTKHTKLNTSETATAHHEGRRGTPEGITHSTSPLSNISYASQIFLTSQTAIN